MLGSQGEVWRITPNPLKEGVVVLVADDREKLEKKMEDGHGLTTFHWSRWKIQCSCGSSKFWTAETTYSQVVQLELCAEPDSLPPFKRSPENSNGGDRSTVSKVAKRQLKLNMKLRK